MSRVSSIVIATMVGAFALIALVPLYAPASATEDPVADHLSVTTQSAGAVAGAAFSTQPIVEIRDEFENPIVLGVDETADVTATIDPGCTLQGTTTVAASAGVATFTNLRIDCAGAHTLTFTKADTSGSGGTNIAPVESSSFDVTPASLDHFLVENAGGGDIGTQTAGVSFDVTITAQDLYDNTVTGFTDTVDISSSQGCSSGCIASAAFSSGVSSSNSVTLTEAGSGATVTATTTGSVEFGTSNLFTVVPASLDHLTKVSGDSQAVSVGTAFADLVVEAVDQYGNPIPGETISFTAPTSGASATLGDSSALTGSNGQATMTASAGTLPGSYDVTASDGSALVEFSLTNNTGPLQHFLVKALGGGNIGAQTAGTAFDMQIAAQDAYGNTVTGFSGTVEVSSNRTCTAGCTTSWVFTNGLLSSHSVTLTKAGTGATVTATATGASEAGTSNTFPVSSAGAATVVRKAGSNQSKTVNTAFSTGLQVEVDDVYGNPVSGVTVSFSAPGSGASASFSNANPATGATGRVTVTATANTVAGSYQVTASVTSLGSVTFNLTNNPGALHHFVVVASSGALIGPQTAGTPFLIKATAKDAYSNTVTSFTGTVTITSNRKCSAGCGTSPAFVAGLLASRSITLTGAGENSKMTVTGGGKTSSSTAFTVSPAEASKLAFTSSTSNLRRKKQRILTVEVRDTYGNRVDSSAEVSFAKVAGSGTGTVAGLPTISDAEGGVAVTSVVGLHTGTLKIKATSPGLTSATTTFKASGSEAPIARRPGSRLSGPLRPTLNLLYPLSSGRRSSIGRAAVL
jgi:adhesin/invasin